MERRHAAGRLSRRLAAGLLCLAIFGAVSPAVAQAPDRTPDDDKASDGSSSGHDPSSADPAMRQAQALFDEGIRYFNQGRFEEACPRFEKSLALVAGVGTRGKLAECWERMGRTASAHRLYREVERLARKQDDETRARVAQERADALEPSLAYLTIVPGPSAGRPGFTITRNGLVVDPRMLDTAVPVDPGEYIVTATAPGHEIWKTKLRVDPAKRAEVAIPALVAGAGQDDPGGRGGRSIGAIVLFSAGAASLLGGTTTFALLARSRRNEAENSKDCDKVDGTLFCTPDSSGDTAARRARLFANLANVTAGVGLAAIATGAVLWWRSGKSAGESKDTSQRAHLVPVLSPSGAGIVLVRPF